MLTRAEKGRAERLTAYCPPPPAASAAMTLDIYADLFDDDLDAVSAALQEAVSATSVGKMWATTPNEE